MREDLQKAVYYLRLGMEGEGNHYLARFLQELGSCWNDPGLPQKPPLPLILPHLQSMVEAQQRGDYLRVADLLEYEIQIHIDP